MISIIHPSRGRPEKSFKTIHKWIMSAVNLTKPQIIISLDSNDPFINDYMNLYKGQFTIIIEHNRSAIDAINRAAKKADGDILMVVSDDTEPINFWDEKILFESLGKSDWIMKTQDGIQPWIITMPVMDRAYYNRFGYIYHPDYLHMFCDTELTCVADITGRKITSNLLFPHKHYSITKEQPDAVNKKADATWQQGEKLFLERYKRNFDLPPGNPIQDNGMIRYLQRKLR